MPFGQRGLKKVPATIVGMDYKLVNNIIENVMASLDIIQDEVLQLWSGFFD